VGDWPISARSFQPGVVVGPQSLVSPLCAAVLMSAGNYSSAPAWPAANRAILIPFTLSYSFQLKQAGWTNGPTVSGHYDVGVYDANGGNLIVSDGGNSQSGTNQPQLSNLADTWLNAGHYLLAFVLDNATGTIYGPSTHNLLLQGCGLQQAASAYPLPSSVTLANPAASYLPGVTLLGNSVA
jgi:hypothetical protein